MADIQKMSHRFQSEMSHETSLKDVSSKRCLIVLILTCLITTCLIQDVSFALENSTIVCLDNTTLLENITVYKDGNSSWYALPTQCQYGCDENTDTCAPAPYIQYAVIFGVICIGSALLWRAVK